MQKEGNPPKIADASTREVSFNANEVKNFIKSSGSMRAVVILISRCMHPTVSSSHYSEYVALQVIRAGLCSTGVHITYTHHGRSYIYKICRE